MLATLGDLVEDVVVYLSGPVNQASDTSARIMRRRGGSAANVAQAAAAQGHHVRFLGQVGSDAIGAALIDTLGRSGVDVEWVQRGGRTGTIIVLVDEHGERSMLPDRGACLELTDPEQAWLEGVSTLHVPFYSFSDPPLADTAATLIGWAHELGIRVSIDVSSVALIDEIGADRVMARLEALRPAVVFANGDEASALGITGAIAGAVTVVKHGSEPVEVYDGERHFTVRVPPIEHVTDTTGAGDAFAAGYLTADAAAPESAVVSGCRAAAQLICSR